MRKKILIDTVSLNAASLICQAIGIVQTLLIMRFLDPYYLGLWLGLNIILMYGAYAHFGIEYGFTLRFPYYKGQKRNEQVLRISDTGYFTWSALTAVFSLGVFAYGVFAPNCSHFERMGLVIIAGLMIAEQQINFLARWQTSALKDFKMASILSALRGGLAFCVLVPVTFFFNIKGMMVGSLLIAVFFALVWWIRTSYRFRANISLTSFLEMIKIGFPILLVVAFGKFIETMDRVLIISFLGPASLGYYSVTGFGGGAAYGLILQAGGAMSPHMTEDFGKNNDSAPSLKKYLIKPTLVFAYVMAVLLMILVFFIPLIVSVLIPKYIPGLKAFYCFIPGFFFLGIILTANHILNLILISRKCQRLAVYFQAFVLLIEIGFGLLFIKFGWDIAGVALASTAAYVVYGSGILWWASRYVLPDWKEHLVFIADVIMPFVIVLAASFLIYLLGQKVFPKQLLLRSLMQLLLCGLAVVPLAFRFQHKTGIYGDLKLVMNMVLQRFKGVV